ncbi:hypothetical protein H257_14366 [Aphanomyces astaci]|uniref:Uncharacterized protein n=1 Tax=Aphanomyces astaci TaxID=112090 RepID=W4FTL3_APHAT|nr:hypothetical protein H257_14366 [Aphanomyces astaci]ETV69998.1 hypothetical protein H257_14366 [Aphanomyces astaci]|eukprot:XP_009840441.1 hypothetical protein H257_14366 [Aphanomyces astaci]
MHRSVHTVAPSLRVDASVVSAVHTIQPSMLSGDLHACLCGPLMLHRRSPVRRNARQQKSMRILLLLSSDSTRHTAIYTGLPQSVGDSSLLYIPIAWIHDALTWRTKLILQYLAKIGERLPHREQSMTNVTQASMCRIVIACICAPT